MRHFGVEHFKCDYVDEHDPDWAVEDVLFVLDEGDGRDALGLQLPAVRVGSLQLPVDILLELAHVKKPEGLVRRLKQARARQLQNVVGNRILLQTYITEQKIKKERRPRSGSFCAQN